MKIRDESHYDPEKIVAIRKIIKLMDFWKISPHELRGVVIAPRKPAVVHEIRYRHPITDLTWDGQGGQPQWLRDALIKEGYTVQELRCADRDADVETGGGDLRMHSEEG
jgi:DNA-binding protein H-NS